MICLDIPFPYWQILTSYVVRSDSKEIPSLEAGARNLIADYFTSMFAG